MLVLQLSLILQAFVGANAVVHAPDAPPPVALRALPVLKRPLNPPLPESEQALGHNGVVRVWVVVGADGRPGKAVVRNTSGSAALDEIAWTSMQTAQFKPARDLAGRPVATRITVVVAFGAYRTSQAPGGIRRYRCQQFVRDVDWWQSTHPGVDWNDHPLYRAMATVDATSTIFTRSGMSLATIAAAQAGLPVRWAQAIATCRTQPDVLLVDVMKPEGDQLRRSPDFF